MKKKIILTLVVAFSALSLASCKIGWLPVRYNLKAENRMTFVVYAINPLWGRPLHDCVAILYDRNFNVIESLYGGGASDRCEVTIDCKTYMEYHQVDEMYVQIKARVSRNYLNVVIGRHYWHIIDTE